MTFASAILTHSYENGVHVVTGTFTNSDGGTGGDIETGLRTVYFIKLTHTGSTAATNAPVVNETLPCTGTVTIVTDADFSGTWIAIGGT